MFILIWKIKNNICYQINERQKFCLPSEEENILSGGP